LSSLVKSPLDIYSKRFTACVIICLCDKWLSQQLPERHEWDHEINLIDEAPKKLNAKAYAMTLKKKEALNQ